MSGTPIDASADLRRRRLERLIGRLPNRVQGTVKWLLLPSSRWVRLLAGVLLILGSVFSILPLLGLWMLPLGVVLLAEDVPVLRRLTGRGLEWIEHHRPHWLSPASDTPRQNESSEKDRP
jgi:hypothetical protein